MPASQGRPQSSAAEMRKKRNIRKGTKSCWQCKRRKIRCTFAAPTNTICDGCKSRRTKCISQEYNDDQTQGKAVTSEASILGQTSMNKETGQQSEQEGAGHHYYLPDSPSPAYPSESPLVIDTSTSPYLNEVEDNSPSRILFDAWPSLTDLELILDAPVSFTTLSHGVVCQPYSEFSSKQIISPRNIIQRPPQGSHPILIARKLLLLASLLQSIPFSGLSKLKGLSSSCHTVMTRCLNAATQVTNNDDLNNSIEGIECIMIESMYHNNAGNLRRAWLTNRKAMVVAQLLGLHTGVAASNIFLDESTRDRIVPEYMWFRLICSDRYLSLMLGLPQGWPDDNFISQEMMDNCSPLERMERIEAVVGGLILKRNLVDRKSFEEVYKIDNMLCDAAALMPPQWWLTPSNLAAIADNNALAFTESVRLMHHFAYHHLLVQLHLPYMMLSDSIESEYNYSKMAAINASRTILTQFVAFRSSLSSNVYCRGIDFIAFIASITLCIAHMEANKRCSTPKDGDVPAYQFLQHQRLSDRGLLERTLEVMASMAQEIHDAVTERTYRILQPLLAIEGQSQGGSQYRITSSVELNSLDHDPSPKNPGDTVALRIQIPYFGLLRIEKLPDPSKDTYSIATTSEAGGSKASSSRQATTDGTRVPEAIELSSTSRRIGYTIDASEPENPDWQVVPSLFSNLASMESAEPHQDMSMESSRNAHLIVPGLEADVEDWALQGVDLALFSNFI